jgi:hypothetical protein
MAARAHRTAAAGSSAAAAIWAAASCHLAATAARDRIASACSGSGDDDVASHRRPRAATTKEDSMQDTRGRNGGTQTTAGSSVADSPVDDATYNLLQALTSKLEAIEAYELYAEQDEDGVFNELLEDERQHAERLLEALRGRLAGS